MLKELKFVMGAISRKDLVPAMKHFAIEGGRVRAYNGVLALSSPIPFNIDCYPKADTLIKAIANCDETVTMSLTPGGKLSVKSGIFKALIACVDKSEVHLEPEGERVECDGAALLQGFKVVEPFVGDDASRPWANGILLRGQSAFATNNVTLVEYWLGVTLPETVNIPHAAIKKYCGLTNRPNTCKWLSPALPSTTATVAGSGRSCLKPTGLTLQKCWTASAKLLPLTSVYSMRCLS